MPGGGPILYGQPVEWGHPLSRGLAAWWLPPPGPAGRTLHDLCGRYPGTLVGGAAWGAGPPAGGPAVRLDGLSGYVDFGTFDPGGAAATIAASTRVDAAQSGSAPHYGITNVFGPDLWASGGGSGREFCLRVGDGGGNPMRAFALAKIGGTTVTASGPDLTAGRWYHLLLSYTGASLTLYVDGRSVASASASGTLTAGAQVVAGASVWNGDVASSGRYLNGAVGDCSWFRRGLSAAEAWGWYDQWRRGYPDLLRRAPVTRRGGFAAGPPPPPPANSFPAAVVGGGYGW